MGVPAEIRAVERPRNTVVVETKSKGPSRYAVRERLKSVYKKGENPKPRNGKTIGHIIDLKFVPLQECSKIAEDGPQWLSYGACALVRSEADDLIEDLLAVYAPKDAYTIMAIATLKVIRPKITATRLSTHYNRTFVCRHYPGVPLSANTVSKFYQLLGQDSQKRQRFYERRIAAVCEHHHIAIDGTLKQNTSTVNDLSAFSRKARVKGCEDISILYAYDIELQEPVCAQVFPGNVIDASAFSSFINTNNISKGIIVADKGFPPSQIQKELAERPQLHYLAPLRRNDTRIAKYNMLDMQGVVSGIEEQVLCKKVTTPDGLFLYGFRSLSKANAEEYAYIARSRRKGDFDKKQYDAKSRQFGTIVFVSDQDLTPEQAYRCYADRWLLEMVFDQYKNDECLDVTRVQGDFSVWGTEFVNFIATVLTCRIIRRAQRAKVLDAMTYGDMMEDLSQAWRSVQAPVNEKPRTKDGHWINVTTKIMTLLEALGLSEAEPKPAPKKRGRPRKEKQPKPEFVGPKRPRGRPRKEKQAAPQEQSL